MDQQDEFTLAQAADACAMTERNVRAYRSRGLLPPVLRRGRRVVYTHEHVARLRLVRALRARGLSLRVVADLVERGAADAELARQLQEDLSAPPAGQDVVPLVRANALAYEAANPGGTQRLVDAGLLVRRRDGTVTGSTASLGLTSALQGRGLVLEDVLELCVEVAETATGLAPRVEQVVTAPGVAGEHVDDARALLVQLLSAALGDVLTRRTG